VGVAPFRDVLDDGSGDGVGVGLGVRLLVGTGAGMTGWVGCGADVCVDVED
jgi:hypothetical protein